MNGSDIRKLEVLDEKECLDVLPEPEQETCHNR